MQKASILFLVAILLHSTYCWSQVPKTDLKTFVTTTYQHGMPYDEAKAFGPKVIPQLVTMLNDGNYEDYRPNIVSMIGRIGDAKAIKPLKNYLYSLKGEISYPTFISALAIFQALGYIAQNGNGEALKMLQDWTDPEYYSKSGLSFSYGNYKGSLMGSSISSLAIQGLGISGRPEALSFLKEMDNRKSSRHKQKLENSVKSAIKLNNRVKAEGPSKVFGKEGLQ